MGQEQAEPGRVIVGYEPRVVPRARPPAMNRAPALTDAQFLAAPKVLLRSRMRWRTRNHPDYGEARIGVAAVGPPMAAAFSSYRPTNSCSPGSTDFVWCIEGSRSFVWMWNQAEATLTRGRCESFGRRIGNRFPTSESQTWALENLCIPSGLTSF
jgi:hypothetical protein